MPDYTLPLALHFMLAARRAELDELQGLVSTGELVTLISQLVHDLQKERGYSNIYLGSPGGLHHETLDNFSTTTAHSEAHVRRRLEGLESGGWRGRARLLTHIAHALHALDGLPLLRRRVRAQDIAASDATAGFTRLIGSLLAVVFEVADSAFDPDITREMVAMFNFMQGKELAGQERATGVTGFSAGFFTPDQQALMQQLRDGQQRCLETFCKHAKAPVLALWETVATSEAAAQLERLRGVGQRTSASATVEASLGELWFDTCTQRINAMKDVENLLAEDILQQCRQRISRTREELDNHRALARRLSVPDSPRPRLFSVQTRALDGPFTEPAESSLQERVQEQTQRLQRLEEELKAARAALEERRRIDQAKRLLMKEQGLSEQAAHDHLLRTAMNNRMKVADVARQILEASG